MKYEVIFISEGEEYERETYYKEEDALNVGARWMMCGGTDRCYEIEEVETR